MSNAKKFDKAVKKLHSENVDVRDEGLVEIRDLLPNAEIAEKVVAAACDRYPTDAVLSVNADLLRLFWNEERHDPCLVDLIETHFDRLQFDREAQTYSLRVLSEMRTAESLKAMAKILMRPTSRTVEPQTAFVALEEPKDVDSHLFPELLDAFAGSEHWFDYYQFLLNRLEAGAFDPNQYPRFVSSCLQRMTAILDEHSGSIGSESDMPIDELEKLIDVKKELQMLLDLAKSFDADEVDDLLRRALGLESTRLRLFATTSLIARGHDVPSDGLAGLAAHPSDRWILWEMLDKIDRLNCFPEQYRTQRLLAEAEMVDWLEYPTEMGYAPSEIELLTRVTTHADDDVRDSYMFRFRDDEFEEGEWLAGWTGPYPCNEAPRIGGRRTFSRINPVQSKAIEDHVLDFVESTTEYQLEGEQERIVVTEATMLFRLE